MKVKLQWHEDYNGNDGYEEVVVETYSLQQDALALVLERKSKESVFVDIISNTKTRYIPLRWLREFTVEE